MKRHGFAILILATLFAPQSLSAQGLDYNILCTLQQNRTETMDHVMTGLSNTLALTPVAPAAMLGTGWMTDNKELLVIEGATHTDLYDGGDNNAIPFDKLQEFFGKYL